MNMGGAHPCFLCTACPRVRNIPNGPLGKGPHEPLTAPQASLCLALHLTRDCPISRVLKSAGEGTKTSNSPKRSVKNHGPGPISSLAPPPSRPRVHPVPIRIYDTGKEKGALQMAPAPTHPTHLWEGGTDTEAPHKTGHHKQLERHSGPKHSLIQGCAHRAGPELGRLCAPRPQPVEPPPSGRPYGFGNRPHFQEVLPLSVDNSWRQAYFNP